MVADGRKTLQSESCWKGSALPWVRASAFAGGGPTVTALPPARRGGQVFGRWVVQVVRTLGFNVKLDPGSGSSSVLLRPGEIFLGRSISYLVQWVQ